MIPLIVGAVTALASMAAQARGQGDANAMNHDMMGDNQRFQAEMSNTAHQREVQDLKAAGLNPILSANAGASSPAGGVGPAAQNPYEGMASSARDFIALRQQQEKQDVDIKNTEQQTMTAKAAEKLNNALSSKANKEADTLSFEAKAAKIKESILDGITGSAKDLLNRNKKDSSTSRTRTNTLD